MESGFIKLDEYLQKYDKFVISTHESPDADGLGAEIAFNELLRSLGKISIIINSDPVPETVKFIDVENEINIYDRENPGKYNIEGYAQFVLDTNDYENIGAAHSYFSSKVSGLFIIDHHEGDRNKFEKNFIKVEASSASEIIYDIIQYYKKPLSFKSAQAIYTGMLFDTGSFRYPKTSAWTYRIAAHCMEMGADPFLCYEHLYESNTLSSFELRSRILSSMEVLAGGRVIALKLTRDMLHDSHAAFVEGESAINLPLTVKGVRASLLVKQDYEGPVKISMRTKGDYNVAEIAMANGGGGHKNAAGFKSNLSFDEAYAHAVKSVCGLFENEQNLVKTP